MEKTESKTVNLSPSRLNLLNECQYCFWLKEAKGIKRGDGPMPSIPRGIDRDLKKHYDQYRGSVTPELVGKITTEVLFGSELKDSKLLESWRVWQKRSFFYEDKEIDVRVAGAIDDCLVTPGGVMIPLDYKTKASLPKTDGREYYGNQLDCYQLFLDHLGYKTAGYGYLVYYWPAGVEPTKNPLQKGTLWNFQSKVFRIESSPERAKELIALAVDIIRGKQKPARNPKCGHCLFAEQVKGVELENSRA